MRVARQGRVGEDIGRCLEQVGSQFQIVDPTNYICRKTGLAAMNVTLLCSRVDELIAGNSTPGWLEGRRINSLTLGLGEMQRSRAPMVTSASRVIQCHHALQVCWLMMGWHLDHYLILSIP